MTIAHRANPYAVPEMGRIRHIHFIGIGGSGMCGIAEVLLNQGYIISGSDQQASEATERLTRLGATVYPGQALEQVAGADVVVASTAIAPQNPELRRRGTRAFPWCPGRKQGACAIATASPWRAPRKDDDHKLVTALLDAAGFDPTFIIGGLVKGFGSNVASEPAACWWLRPTKAMPPSCIPTTVAVLTNIDADHMATYDGDFEKLKQAFLDFIHRMPFYGTAVVCIDDACAPASGPGPTSDLRFSDDADVRAEGLMQREGATFGASPRASACPWRWPSRTAQRAECPGGHRRGQQEGVSDISIRKALDSFAGWGGALSSTLAESVATPCRSTTTDTIPRRWRRCWKRLEKPSPGGAGS